MSVHNHHYTLGATLYTGLLENRSVSSSPKVVFWELCARTLGKLSSWIPGVHDSHCIPWPHSRADAVQYGFREARTNNFGWVGAGVCLVDMCSCLGLGLNNPFKWLCFEVRDVLNHHFHRWPLRVAWDFKTSTHADCNPEANLSGCWSNAWKASAMLPCSLGGSA